MLVWVKVETLARHDASDGDFRIKRRLEHLSGEPCLVLHMSQATPETVLALSPRALFLSGCATWFRDFDVREFYVFENLVHATESIPALAICGSHQLLGFMFNDGFRNLKRVIDEPMRPLHDGEAQIGWWISPETAGMFTEQGYYPIRPLVSDPLFAGLPNPCVMPESHACEIKRVPDAFELIATNDTCRVQAIKHRSRPLYGTQFHPEQWVAEYSDGELLLRNFLRIAGIGD